MSRTKSVMLLCSVNITLRLESVAISRLILPRLVTSKADNASANLFLGIIYCGVNKSD